MITLLLCWLIKNYRGDAMRIADRIPEFLRTSNKKVLLILLKAFLLVLSVNGQNRMLQYKIMHKGDQVGAMVFYENKNGKNIHIKIESEVKAGFILPISVKSVEEAIFRDGILTYSSVYRKVNGDEQVNRRLQVNGIGYNATDNDEYNTPPAYPVHYNILSLYYCEPGGITRVYSDNFRQYVEVEKMDSNVYKLNLPNGNSIIYTYRDGVCTRVDVNQSFYSMQFLLTH